MSGYIGNILVPQATQTRDSFIATAGQTSFPTSGYTPNFLDVYLNGIKLHSSDFTATNGSDVVLTTGAAVNDVIEVVAYNAFDVASGTFDDLTVNNNIAVSGTVDGRDIATDGTKLDGIESGATGDQTNAEIRAAVEAATDSNVFTDADHTKLNAIEASATADQTAAEIRTLVESATDSNVFTDADHTKLNAIEANATADQTKSDIDALNINADTLDGQHGSYYTGYADTAVANIVDSAPGTLDTLNELAAALGDDPNFATTVTNSIATKLPLAGGTLTGNVTFGDNDKAIFGAGSDLQIYHDGSNSYIKDEGTGNLRIRGTSIELSNADGSKRYGEYLNGDAVKLYYDGTKKFETTSTGIDVTGTVTSDGLTVNPTTSAEISGAVSGGYILKLDNTHASSGNGLRIETPSTASNEYSLVVKSNNGSNNNLVVSNNGDISFYEDTGTTAKFFWDASAELLKLGSLATTGTFPLMVKSNASHHAIHIEEVSGNEGYTLGVDADGDLGFYNSGASTASVTFDDVGNVGIGMASPAAKLDVDGLIKGIAGASSTGGIKLHTNSGINVSANYMSFHTGQTNGFSFNGNSDGADNSNQLMVINGNGNVGIGATSPGEKLHVEGSIRASGNIGVTQTDGDYVAKLYQSSADGFLELYTGEATPVSRVKLSSYGDSYIAPSTNSGLGIGTTSPGHKLDVDGGSIRVQDVGQYIYFGSNSSVKVGTVSSNANDLYLGSADDINMESNFIRLWRDGYYGSTEYGRLSFSDDSWLCTGSSSHYLGIGTNNPTEKLHVSGNVSATAYYGDGSNLTGVGGSTTYYAVGTYLFGFHLQNNGTISGGGTKAGSTLRPAGLGWNTGSDGNERSVNGGVWHGVESAPAGTWRFMSSMTTNISGRYPGGVWVGIS